MDIYISFSHSPHFPLASPQSELPALEAKKLQSGPQEPDCLQVDPSTATYWLHSLKLFVSDCSHL